MNPGQPPQGQPPNNTQQPAYNMYDQHNSAADYNRQPNYQPDRGQPNMGMNSAQNYQGYSQQPQAQPPQSQSMQNYNYGQSSGGAPGYGQPNPAASQQQDRMQNYNSFHETSAPIGGNVQPGQYASKPNDYSTQHERSIGPAAGLFRSDGGMQQNYPPTAMPDLRGQNQYSGIGKRSDLQSNRCSGQGSNQNQSHMPGQQMYSQPSGIDAGGMHTGSQSFHLANDMGGAGGLPQISIGGGQPMMGMGAASQNKADPSNMDISTLNRMAEYYATNSDYPKVKSQFNVFRLSNILRK